MVPLIQHPRSDKTAVIGNTGGQALGSRKDGIIGDNAREFLWGDGTVLFPECVMATQSTRNIIELLTYTRVHGKAGNIQIRSVTEWKVLSDTSCLVWIMFYGSGTVIRGEAA